MVKIIATLVLVVIITGIADAVVPVAQGKWLSDEPWNPQLIKTPMPPPTAVIDEVLEPISIKRPIPEVPTPVNDSIKSPFQSLVGIN